MGGTREAAPGGGERMKYYFAPMEGITGSLFRRVHRQYFPGVYKYFMPFVSPGQERVFSKRDRRELSPGANQGVPAVPQLLTCRSEDFLWAAERLAEWGYREVNLNLGCPSGTVTAKGKGAGALRDPAALDRLLEGIFSQTPLPVSVKTRLGFQSPEEFDALLTCFRRYPIAELIVHPRVRADFYRGSVCLEAFATAETVPFPLCYNGDLATGAEMGAFREAFPWVGRMMLGRGLVGNPALVIQAEGGQPVSRKTLRDFHDTLYEGYALAFGSRHNAMLRMKELWFYLIWLFDGAERYGKQLRKARTPAEFDGCAAAIFQELELLPASAAGWRDRPFPLTARGGPETGQRDVHQNGDVPGVLEND